MKIFGIWKVELKYMQTEVCQKNVKLHKKDNIHPLRCFLLMFELVYWPFLNKCFVRLLHAARNKFAWLFAEKAFQIYWTRGGSRTVATSKMECLVIIVNGWKPLIIITKHSILDAAAALDPRLMNNTICE